MKHMLMKLLIKRKLLSLLVVATLICLALPGCGVLNAARRPSGDALQTENTPAGEPSAAKDDSPAKGENGVENGADTIQKPQPVIQTLTLTATGDCTLGRTQTHGYAGSFYEYYDRYGEDYFFDGVRDIFEKDDLTLINLECVLTSSEDIVAKDWNLKGKPEYVGIMTGSSVEACSLGNNHTKDYGAAGLAETKEVLNNAGIVYGYNDEVGIYTTKDGLTVGIVSADLLSEAAVYEDFMRDGIAWCKSQGVSLTVACCHWGRQGHYYLDDYDRNIAHKIVDWGADVVIGNHPHVLQGVELYNGKIICYSLGNFCFGGNRNPPDKNTMIYQQTFTFTDGVLQPEIQARIIPCTVSSVSSRNDFQPTVASGEKKQDIIDCVNDYSAPYSSVFFDGNGVLQVPAYP